MFTTENTPRYGQTVMHGSKVVTVRSFMGVLADAVMVRQMRGHLYRMRTATYTTVHYMS
jgi:hypothetical protein